MLYDSDMEKLLCEIKPIPNEHIRAIEDGETLKIGGAKIQALETPGHASHHHAYAVDGTVFTGEVGGIHIENGLVLPPTPPPDINLELWKQSIKKLRELNPEVIHPTHFGKFTNIEEHFDQLERLLFKYNEWVGSRLKEGVTGNDLIPEFENLNKESLKEAQVVPGIVEAYELADPFWLNVLGLERYWRKFELKN